MINASLPCSTARRPVSTHHVRLEGQRSSCQSVQIPIVGRSIAQIVAFLVSNSIILQGNAFAVA